MTLAVGGITCGALYWAFLNTPESNTWMLGLSTLLVTALVAIAALATNTAVLVGRGSGISKALAPAVRGAGWFLVAISPLVIGSIFVLRMDQWVIERQGEINAWFIAQFGWADISRLLHAHVWTSRWVRWAVLPVISVSLLAALLLPEDRRHGAWLRRATHWRTLVIATFAYIFLFVWPWQLTTWRPELPPTWVEPTVAALRLGAALLAGLLGATLIVLAASHAGPVHPTRGISTRDRQITPAQRSKH
jgi:hypothetical protein